MISIIIPVYNVDAYLSECLNSILLQTVPDYEVILIDDGSQDKSGVICDTYAQKDTRIRVIHQKNSGVSTARNNGIEQSRGEWITFIDSDDWIKPNYLANFHLDESNDIDLVIQGLEYYNQRNKLYFNPWSFKDCVLEKSDFQRGFSENRLLEVGFPVGKAYRKDLIVINNLHFDTRISFHEDHIFVLDYYKLCNSVRLVNSTDYKYRCYHTNSSLSSKQHPWEKMNLAGDEMLRRFLNMQDEFFPKNSDNELKLYDFAYSCKITAANSIILDSTKSFNERKTTFYRIIKREDIRKYSHPASLQNKITTFLYTYMPFCICFAYNKLIQFLKYIK